MKRMRPEEVSDCRLKADQYGWIRTATRWELHAFMDQVRADSDLYKRAETALLFHSVRIARLSLYVGAAALALAVLALLLSGRSQTPAAQPADRGSNSMPRLPRSVPVSPPATRTNKSPSSNSTYRPR